MIPASAAALSRRERLELQRKCRGLGLFWARLPVGGGVGARWQEGGALSKRPFHSATRRWLGYRRSVEPDFRRQPSMASTRWSLQSLAAGEPLGVEQLYSVVVPYQELHRSSGRLFALYGLTPEEIQLVKNQAK